MERSEGSIVIDEVRGHAIKLMLPHVLSNHDLDTQTLSWTGDRLVSVLYHIHQAWRLSELSRDRLTRAIHPSDVLVDPYL